MKSRVELKGMKIDNVDKEGIFTKINEEVIGKSKGYISITNTEAMYIGSNNKKHAEFINN
jgi:UDP-N-acetyl-D-mannosaminuronic acid transferase (WecB/TagA/CpsF family)